MISALTVLGLLAVGAVILGLGIAIGFALGIGLAIWCANGIVRWLERKGMLP